MIKKSMLVVTLVLGNVISIYAMDKDPRKVVRFDQSEDPTKQPKNKKGIPLTRKSPVKNLKNKYCAQLAQQKPTLSVLAQRTMLRSKGGKIYNCSPSDQTGNVQRDKAVPKSYYQQEKIDGQITTSNPPNAQTYTDILTGKRVDIKPTGNN